jgi:hypothetical protein
VGYILRQTPVVADSAASEKLIAASKDDVDLTLQEPGIKDRVTQVRKVETQLAPLFAEGVASEFRSRWDIVQRVSSMTLGAPSAMEMSSSRKS